MKIIWLTGASGVGKTTLLQNLKEKYSSKQAWDFLKFDSIGVPSNEEMVKEFGSGENWQKAKTFEWIEKMVTGYEDKKLVVMDGQSNMEFIKAGFEKHGFTNYQIILIDCEQDIMIKRLIDERQQAWLVSEDTKNWLKFLRNLAQNLGIPIIDTSAFTQSEVVKAFEQITQK